MALKNIDNANPLLKEYWMELSLHGRTLSLFPQKKMVANIRAQLSTFRNLAARQAPTFYSLIRDLHLQTQQDLPSGMFFIQAYRAAGVSGVSPPEEAELSPPAAVLPTEPPAPQASPPVVASPAEAIERAEAAMRSLGLLP